MTVRLPIISQIVPRTVLRQAVFLDRDGTLIRDPGYLSDPQGVELLPAAVEGLHALREQGLLLVLVSNQSGIGRGFFSREDLLRVHARLLQLLTKHGLSLDAAYYCPHAPWEGCSCRKPQPGMLEQAARELGIELARSFMVGDKPEDVDAGRRAGCRTLLLTRGTACGSSPEAGPDRAVPDLHAAARWISGEAPVPRSE